MSSKYLNDSGLSYFWSKLKAYFARKATTLAGYGITDAKIESGTITLGPDTITPLTSVPSHNQASNTINAMTGYSRPSSTSAISASDTLNQAVGKLEQAIGAADISNVVHRTGDETVAGRKSFTDSTLEVGGSTSGNLMLKGSVRKAWLRMDPAGLFYILLSDSAADDSWNSLRPFWIDLSDNTINTRSIFVFNNTSYTGTSGLPASDGGLSIRGTDANGNRTHGMHFFRTTAGRTSTYIRACRAGNSEDYADLAIYCDLDGTKFATCPTPANSVTGNYIVTAEWVLAKNYLTSHQSLSNYVTLNSAQSITAVKTFTDTDIKINNTSISASGTSSGTASLAIRAYGSNSAATHSIHFFHSSANSNVLYIRAYKYNNSDVYGDLTIQCDSDGSVYATCPTPDANANSGKIATTEWVRTFCDTTRGYYKQYQNVFEAGRYIDLHYDGSTAAYDYDVRLQASSQGTAAGGGNFTVTAAAMYIPAPASNANDARAATTKWVNDKGYLTSHQSLSNYVTLDGTQTITGTKTFTNWPRISSGTPTLCIDATGMTATSATAGSGRVTLYDKSGTHDDGHSIARVIMGRGQTSGGDNVTYVRLDAWTGNSSHTNKYVAFHYYNSTSLNPMLYPSVDNDFKLGEASHRWKQLYAGTATISTSDLRLKTEIASIDSEILDAWEDIQWSQFKFNDAVSEKGGAARIHAGAVAQQILAAFSKAGLDAGRYAFFCHDGWDASDALRDECGAVLEPARPAGDVYSLRYEEALCIEAAYMRRENARLKKRVADLEDRLAALELRLGSE